MSETVNFLKGRLSSFEGNGNFLFHERRRVDAFLFIFFNDNVFFCLVHRLFGQLSSDSFISQNNQEKAF